MPTEQTVHSSSNTGAVSNSIELELLKPSVHRSLHYRQIRLHESTWKQINERMVTLDVTTVLVRTQQHSTAWEKSKVCFPFLFSPPIIVDLHVTLCSGFSASLCKWEATPAWIKIKYWLSKVATRAVQWKRWKSEIITRQAYEQQVKLNTSDSQQSGAHWYDSSDEKIMKIPS